MTTSPPRHCAVHCLPHNGSLSEVAVRAARVKDWKRIDRIVYVKTSSVMVCWGYVVSSYVSRQSLRLGSADVLGCLLDDAALIFCRKKSLSHKWPRPMHIDPTAQLHPFPISEQ
ncbi:hypothetical protein MGG_17117 [Pyricularia oryzae 70-15]|uniref:Uncharacterized protein n=1 Tax=Pyricularia oryzae (strain 70-15 / ATCC MYA-4617 / FGSC 8958) TaxID=242507 RepID=G4N992_PYRO7|nr:uncharacterized protein MGG_17117 [Pyricularia oryzae 70-15]EHA50336.1 hypothetical protein MGG_17117 [Pyricularia oryzae 70-15]